MRGRFRREGKKKRTKRMPVSSKVRGESVGEELGTNEKKPVSRLCTFAAGYSRTTENSTS